MLPLASLWLPILLSAAAVFIASSVIHMVLTYHRSDYQRLEAEEGIMAALRPFAIPPGDYMMPHAGSPDVMKSPEYVDKLTQGPVALLTVMPNEMPRMGASLVQWFLYCLTVSLFATYLTSRSVGPGAGMMSILQIAATAAFMGYGFALVQNSIWYRRRWATTIRAVADSLVYAVLTGVVVGWLWP